MEDRDPVVRAVLTNAVRAPHHPGPGERVDITRFVAGVHEYQRDMYAVLAGTVSSIIDWCTEPLAVRDRHRRGVLFDYLGFRPVLEVDDADNNNLHYVVYGNDWRRFPASTPGSI